MNMSCKLCSTNVVHDISWELTYLILMKEALQYDLRFCNIAEASQKREHTTLRRIWWKANKWFRECVFVGVQTRTEKGGWLSSSQNKYKEVGFWPQLWILGRIEINRGHKRGNCSAGRTAWANMFIGGRAQRLNKDWFGCSRAFP